MKDKFAIFDRRGCRIRRERMGGKEGRKEGGLAWKEGRQAGRKKGRKGERKKGRKEEKTSLRLIEVYDF
jgi:hypothetical protein